MTASTYASAHYHSLDGRGVLITGGASGIGAELVRAFAIQGARVVFLDIDDTAADALLAEHPGVAYRHCDLRDVSALRAAVAEADRAVTIDALINNAARDDRQDVFEVEPADWERHLSSNLHHQFFATQAVAREMRARGRGTIVLTGSISWMRGRPGMVGYTTAKAGINGMTNVTERQKRWHPPEADRRFLEDQALKFRLDGSHVARMALFLASDESAGCTGANFIVDAGLTQN
jgi:NAD(P)-dependent dehydrogenase (short-subunit alcohol dehydrogenase family)